MDSTYAPEVEYTAAKNTSNNMPHGRFRNKFTIVKMPDTLTERAEIASTGEINLHLSDSEVLSLSWNDERGEWIGELTVTHWCDFVHSEYYIDKSKPFTLDKKYAKNILEAYRLPGDILTAERVLRMKPADLEKLAQTTGLTRPENEKPESFVMCEDRCTQDEDKCKYKFRIPKDKAKRPGGPHYVCPEKYGEWWRSED